MVSSRLNADMTVGLSLIHTLNQQRQIMNVEAESLKFDNLFQKQ